MDLTGYTDKAGIPYVGAEEVDHASSDHTFSNGPARALICTASGDVKFKMNGDGTDVTIPVVVAAGSHFELRGYLIDKVYDSGTTATVTYGML